jgi:protein-S-isoprenylcysteine O-methyltransferase Ste14
MNSLPIQTARTFIIGVIVLGVLLFLPAGTLAYWQAWVFLVVFLTSANAIGVYLALKDPALLERRKKVGPAAEQSITQRIIISIAIIADLALLVFCAFDHRFAWSPVPAAVSVVGDVLVALGLLINLLVFRENS